jgi:hypothetical protein
MYGRLDCALKAGYNVQQYSLPMYYAGLAVALAEGSKSTLFCLASTEGWSCSVAYPTPATSVLYTYIALQHSCGTAERVRMQQLSTVVLQCKPVSIHPPSASEHRVLHCTVMCRETMSSAAALHDIQL